MRQSRWQSPGPHEATRLRSAYSCPLIERLRQVRAGRRFPGRGGRLTAALVRRLGDFDLAEELVQDSLLVCARALAARGSSGSAGRLADDHGAPPGGRPVAAQQRYQEKLALMLAAEPDVLKWTTVYV